MRFLIGSATASLLLVGSALTLATPGHAEDDIYFNHAKGTMAGAIPQSATQAADQNGRYRASYGQYMQMDPRDAKVSPDASHDVDGDNIYFNHAKGTMGGN